MDRLICRLFGHDVWVESDETGPYQHQCVRCGWTHPWHGHEAGSAPTAADRWPRELRGTQRAA